MFFTLLNYLGVLLACVIVYITIKVWKHLHYFPDRGLPYLKPTWSDMFKLMQLSLFNDTPHEMYLRSHKLGIKSPYIGVNGPLLNPSVLVLDPKLVESILIKDFSYFQDHGFDFDIENNPLIGHLFNMKGDQWRTLRHKLVPTFTSGKLRGMVPIIEECANKLIDEMNGEPLLKTDTNLKELFRKYSLSVIASTAFGIDPESIKDPDCDFRRYMLESVSPRPGIQLKFILGIMAPKLFSLFKIKLFPKDIEDFVFSLMRQSFDMRKKTGMRRNDFIQLLLELKEKGSVDLDIKDLEHDEKEALATLQSEQPSGTLELTEGLLAAQAFVFLIGGFENTAYLVTITSYLLSKHPEIQNKVREEVKQCISENDNSLDYQSLKEMKLLAACVDEALRLYPSIPNLPRQCNRPYTFSDGRKLEKNVPLFLPVKSLQRDPKYWSDPEEFKPERFLNGEKIIPGTYLPFGDGPRLCIAQRMALLVAKMMLAKLVQNYEIQPSAKTKEPINIKILFSADNEGGFWATFKDLEERV